MNLFRGMRIPIFARVLTPSLDEVESALNNLSRRLAGNERFSQKVIEAMTADLTQLGATIGQLEIKYGRQQTHYGDKLKSHAQDVKAAGILQDKINKAKAAGQPTAEMEAQLKRFLDTLQGDAKNVAASKTTGDIMAGRVQKLKEQHAQLARDIVSAREKLTQKSIELDTERDNAAQAEQARKDAEIGAGIRKTSSTLATALNSFQTEIDEMKAKSVGDNLTAGALKQSDSRGGDHIAEALREAQQADAPAPKSTEDILKQLQAGVSQPAAAA